MSDVVHLVPHIGKKASGYSYSVPKLCQALTELGQAVKLITLAGPVENLKSRVPHGLASVRTTALRRVIYDAASNSSLLHSHSLWRMSNVYAAWAASKFQKPHVVSPRGTLSPEAVRHNRVKKFVFSAAFQRRTLQRVTLLHATSKFEYLDIRASRLRPPVVIIPNGVDVPGLEDLKLVRNTPRTLLYVGRIHPIKGLELVFECWGELGDSYPDWILRIIGPIDSEYANRLKEKACAARLPRLEFAGQLSGEELNLELQRADVLVLPSLSENFGMVVAEALANGTPVLTTTSTPWEGLYEKRCGWWVDRRKDDFCGALQVILSADSDTLQSMGRRGRQWMIKDFSWERVASDMVSAYSWLINGGERPEFVRED